MTINLLLILLGITTMGFLVVLDRRDKRTHEDRQANRLEVATLCQRLQAPDAAVYQHAMGDGSPEVSPFPMTDEEIAEMQERDLAIQRIEAMENGGLSS